MVVKPTVYLLVGDKLFADVSELVLSARMSDRAWHEVGTLDMTVADPSHAIRNYITMHGPSAADFSVIVDYGPMPDGESMPVMAKRGRWSGRIDSSISIDSEVGEVSFQAVQDNVIFEQLFLAPDVGKSLEDQAARSMLYTGFPTKLLSYILGGTVARDIHERPPLRSQQLHRLSDLEVYDNFTTYGGADVAVARAATKLYTDFYDIMAANHHSSSAPRGVADVSLLVSWQRASELLTEMQSICGLSARVYRALPGGVSYAADTMTLEQDVQPEKDLAVAPAGCYIDWVVKGHLNGETPTLDSRFKPEIHIPLVDKAVYPRVEVRPGGAPEAVSVTDSPTWMKEVVGGVEELAIALVRASEGDEAANKVPRTDINKALGTLGGVKVSKDNRPRRHAHVRYEMVDGVSADEAIQGYAKRNQALIEAKPKQTIPDQITPPEWVRPGLDIAPGSLVAIETSATETVTEYVEEISASWGSEQAFEWTFSIGQSSQDILEKFATDMTQLGRQIAATGRAALK